MKISACWIAKNEEAVLEKSIGSVLNIADEIIVVDTGSTDGTVKVAESLGAKVFNFEWISDFSAARNFAVSNATGDAIIFLDADEYFYPSLDNTHRADIQKVFRDQQIDAMSIRRSNLNNAGNVKVINNNIRIIRNSSKLHYINKIHEILARKNGDKAVSFLIKKSNWNINHTGYTENLVDDKRKRNIQILEEEYKRLAKDSYPRFLVIAYLMREYYYIDKKKALIYAQLFIADNKFLRKAAKYYGIDFVDRIYPAISLAADNKELFISENIYDNLFCLLKELFPGYLGSKVADLQFKYHFGEIDANFLDDFYTVFEQVRNMPHQDPTDYISLWVELCAFTAYSAWLTGDQLNAFDYAVYLMKDGMGMERHAIKVLLSCMKKQKTQDIILFFESIIDFENDICFSMLLECLMNEEYKDLYVHFKSLHIKKNKSTIHDFLFHYMLINDRQKIIESLNEIKMQLGKSSSTECLFLLSICSDDKTIYDTNRELLMPYSHLLEAYFNQKPLGLLSDTDLKALRRFYPRITMLAGRVTADRFRYIFSSFPEDCFMTKADYYEYILPEELSNDIFSQPLSGAMHTKLIANSILLSDFETANVLIRNCPKITDRRERQVYNLCKSIVPDENAGEAIICNQYGIDRDFMKIITEIKNMSEDELYSLLVKNFKSLPSHIRKSREEYTSKYGFWGSLNQHKNDYGIFKNRANTLYNHRQDFEWLYYRLGDYRSRFCLYAYLNNWYSNDFESLRAAKEQVFKEYFDLELIKCNNDEVFVDLGAYTGDTVQNYIQTYGGLYKQIYCYEISPASFEQLKDSTKALRNIDCRQKGVSDKNGKMYLAEGAHLSANTLADRGSLCIDIVSIDEDIQEAITFIKMDIEGFEQRALLGCKRHIQNEKPKLAISIYHNNEDVWKIARMIDEICEGYQFYMRYQGGEMSPTEMTLIAIHPECS